ncbi:MAG: methionyl-tRNA formyltransferase [Deltaproteobacteria bacterium]|nr:methionyl-tRNA formyltransferase [Deltaproteobacteria bacterium]
MRIILIGQAAFAEKTLDKLVSKGEEVLAVFCPPDAPGGKFDPVKQRALQLGIPVYQHKTLKGPEVREQFVALQADLAILAFVTQIVPPPVFNAPRLGSICFHPSLLPKYRGGSAINWTLIKGETKTGVSLFWVDEGIDTGPILLQKEAAIGPDDTTGSLYFNKLFPLGVEAIGEAVDLIKAGNPPRIPQDESQANYDQLCRDEHARIDWSGPAQEVYNLIRGCDPQPGAHAVWQGKMVRFYDCRLQRDASAASPGQIIEVGEESLNVVVPGGVIIAKKVRGEGGKIAAAEFARQVGLGVGAQLT